MNYGPREALGEIAEMIEQQWSAFNGDNSAYARWLLAELFYCAKAGLDELPDDSEDTLAVKILLHASPRP